MSMDLRNPKVLDPPVFDPEAGWRECEEFVEECGGLTHADGEVNWRAASGADPGCCSCPHCGASYWSWGRVVECLDCEMQFPTDWWAMYSWGVQASRRIIAPDLHEQRLEHPYYRYGFEHPVEDAWDEHDRIPWREALGATYTFAREG